MEQRKEILGDNFVDNFCSEILQTEDTEEAKDSLDDSEEEVRYKSGTLVWGYFNGWYPGN